MYVQVLRAIECCKQHYCGTRNLGRINPYDLCVANQKVKGSQHTILFHVDDLKCSHNKKTVNNDFAKWLERTYGQYGKVKYTMERRMNILE